MIEFATVNDPQNYNEANLHKKEAYLHRNKC